jgi:hypothetical protein
LSYNHGCEFIDRDSCIDTYGCGWCNNVTDNMDQCIPMPICGNISKIYDICEYRDTSTVCNVSNTMFYLMLMVIFLSISFCIFNLLHKLFLRINIGNNAKCMITLLFLGSSVATFIVWENNYKIFEYLFIIQLGLLILFWLCYGGTSAVKIYRNQAFNEFIEFNENEYEPINNN